MTLAPAVVRENEPPPKGVGTIIPTPLTVIWAMLFPTSLSIHSVSPKGAAGNPPVPPAVHPLPGIPTEPSLYTAIADTTEVSFVV